MAKWRVLLVALLLTPFISAYTIEGQQTALALDKLSPFVKINKDYSLTLDEQKAQYYGLSADYIAKGRDYVNFHNKLLPAVKQNGIYNAKLDPAMLAEFEPFFRYVAETGNMHPNAAIVKADSSYDVVISRLFGAEQNYEQSQKILFDYACGGNRDRPHVCPPRLNSGIYRSSQTAISNYLFSLRYHNTYWPGCGTGRFTCTDFTKWISAYGCAYGVFRTQAWRTGSGANWSYMTQSPEPNPELFSYGWPVWWWGMYVGWWHQGYCN